MKKLIVMVLVATMVFVLAACGGGTGNIPAPTLAAPADTPSEKPEPMATPTPTPDAPTVEYPPPAKHIDAEVAIVGTEIIEYEGVPLIKVHYDITNTANCPINLLGNYQIDEELFQNAEEDNLVKKLRPIDGSPEMHNMGRSIAPGVTARVACAYELLDVESEVTVVIPGYAAENIPETSIVLYPQNLLPPLPWPEREPRLNPPLETDSLLGEEGVFVEEDGSFSVKLLGHEFFENGGDKYIRLHLQMQNIDFADAIYPRHRLDNYTFQDGIDLGHREWSNDDLIVTEEDEAIKTKIEPGQTLAFAQVFKLQSDSPVLVRIANDYWSPRGYGSVEISEYVGALIPVE
ncbi:DUF5067 domain-containing protein [Christensenellaceae bacterium OttesenSCG-928-M15]|nr:DUF5067 domain-containing protein [Christensenellaceae bacterium OttesenSCG-928-M15]